MKTEILYSIGKKLRNSYLLGKATEEDVMRSYVRNKKEADDFDPFGLNIFELISMEKNTHNPILRSKLHELIADNQLKCRHSQNQNKLSMQKLMFYTSSALGIGLRQVMNKLRNIIGTTKNKEALILLLMLQIEFANLSAKKSCEVKDASYSRKDYLLKKLSFFLSDNGWKNGVSYKTGKNSSCLIFVYLPDGSQISWHSNDWQMVYYYDEIKCEWDGKPCSTLEKLLTYVHKKYDIGDELEKYRQDNSEGN